jgi:hypothetical protein
MLIICNIANGLRLSQLQLEPGENMIDDDLWTDVAAEIHPRWLADLTTRVGCRPPQLELRRDCQLSNSGFDDGPAAPQLNARDKIAMVEVADTLDALDVLAHNETRKTVLIAIERRLGELADRG